MKDLVFRTAQKEVISSQVRYMVMLSEDNTSGSLPFVIYVKAGDMNYDRLVSLLININYSNDGMQAIINNYLLDKDDEKVMQEFNDMQEWRKKCKSVAKRILTCFN